MSAGFHDASESGIGVDETDYLVVGSGAGGGAAARVLSRSGARVVVLEEGPLVAKEKLNPILHHTLATLFRHQGKQAAFGRAAMPILQGRTVGGTTFVNSAIVWRLPDAVLADWHERFGLGAGLPRRALEDAAAWIEDELSVRPVSENDTASGQDLKMRDGAERAGLAGRFIHRSEKGCRGSGRCLHGCPHEAKQSTPVSSLKRASADGATIFAHATALRVVTEGGRATGVTGQIGGAGRFERQPFRIRARRAVVVAASAVQSPNLLRRSKIRRSHLGDHFMAHPGTTVMGIYPDPVDMWSGASQGFEVLGLRDTLGLKLESINVPPEVAAARFPGAGKRLGDAIDRLDRVACWSLAVRSEAEGRVRPSRLFGDRVAYQLTARDLERVRTGMKRLAEMHFLAGAVEVVTGVHGLPETLRSADELGVFDRAPLDARAYSMVATHLFGGCRAGRDPASSVVDENLQVHGMAGLYVMDASVFPTNTGVNPQHSIMAIASVAAARLCG